MTSRPTCDYCGEPVHMDRNHFWVGDDETSDCSHNPDGHVVEGSK